MKAKLLALTCVSLIATLAPVTARAADEGFAGRCIVDAFKAPPATTITSVRVIEAPVPYCRLDGYVTTSNPGPNTVNFMVALPERHNGRYVFTVQGGAAGFVPGPSETYLRSGYAIASTDKGVRVAHGLDFSFRNDPVQSLDWAHRAVHVSAGATQALTAQFYAGRPFRRFAIGCSGGGDGTLANAELHPEDFDAYVAAAMSVSSLEINHIWGAIAQHLARRPDSWISPEEYARVHTALLAKYDAADGAIDGLIWSPQAIVVDKATLPFLSEAQLDLLRFIQAGLPEQLGTSYPGYWLSDVTAFPRFLTGTTRPPWSRVEDYPAGFMVTATGAQGFFGPQYDILQQIDYADRAALNADREFQAKHGRYGFSASNLAGLHAKGGKIILWTGIADQAVPPRNVLAYTQAAEKAFGKRGREAFMRTFLVPGLNHCSGGVGAPTDTPETMLEAAAQWVETGRPPEAVTLSNPNRDPSNSVRDIVNGGTATKAGIRKYLICAWPKQARFVGGVKNTKRLEVNDARNWRCVG